MRTDSPSPAPPARIEVLVGRARRWIERRGLGGPWALAAGALAVAALGVAVYLANGDVAIDPVLICGGYKFSRDEVVKIGQALSTRAIGYEANERGQIAVPAGQLTQAMLVLQKDHLGPVLSGEDEIRALDQIPFWEGPPGREYRLNLAREQSLKSEIERLDEIDSARVSITRDRPRGFRDEEHVKALVTLEARGGRPIPFKTIQAIQLMLAGRVPDLKPEAVTILDVRGQSYLAPGNPNLGAEAYDRARKEELTAELLAQLSWIDGVRVDVRLDPPPSPPRAESPVASRSSVVAPNTPLSLDPEPSPASRAVVGPRRAPGKARILIQVPIGYFRREYLRDGPGHEPSADDLMPLVSRTEEIIKGTVRHVVPKDELGELEIGRIPAAGPSLTTVAPNHPESRRPIAWWLPAAAVAGTAAVLVGSLRLARRRPSARPDRGPQRPRFDLDEGSGPGPSERVRELVRRNPGAAAGVLQRWIGQGGHAG